MTLSDLESRSMSTIHMIKLHIVVGKPHAKFEGHSLIITRYIVYNAKLGQWLLMTIKVGKGQPYTY
jgi:hypothetical protein